MTYLAEHEIKHAYHVWWSLEARRVYKRMFYAHLYGNFRATRVVWDIQQMYLMGGEL